MAALRMYLVLLSVISVVQANLDNRVVFGSQARIEQFPYIVSFHRMYFLLCGGSLIKPDTVVTAAHCIENIPPDMYSIYMIGAGDNRRVMGKQFKSPVNMIAHPDFRKPLAESNDIGIIIIDDPFELSPKIAIIEIAPASLKWPGGETAQVVGWGRTDKEVYTKNLNFAELDVLNKSCCLEVFVDRPHIQLDLSMQCAGKVNGGQDSCVGDSGGPLVFNGLLIGIVSWGPALCGRAGFPGIYTDVAHFNSWIREHVDLPNPKKWGN